MAHIGIARDNTGPAHGHDHDHARDVAYERTGFRLSWGAIFAGFVAATAIQMVLTVLGGAIGLTAFDPGQGDSAAGLGIGAAVWFAVTALVSMFIGGMTTGRLAGVLTTGDGRLHGVLMWSVSLLFAIYLASVGAGRVLGGVTSMLGQTVSSVAGGAVSGAGAAAGGGGVSVSESQQQQAQAAARDAQQQIQQQAPEIQAQAGAAADQAANVASKGLWGALLVMGLSVAAAAFGAGRTAPE